MQRMAKDELESEGLLRRRSNGQIDFDCLPSPLVTPLIDDNRDGFIESRTQQRFSDQSRPLAKWIWVVLGLCSLLIFGLWVRRLSIGSGSSVLETSQGLDLVRDIQVLNPDQHLFREPSTLHFEWDLSAGFREPDGVRKRVYLINGQFPGPTIECRPGDRLRIVVHNGLEDEGVSLHWHGLQMRNGQNQMDGAVGITQCPIQSGKSFTYEFDIPDGQHGTFWYHAHDEVQRADGMFGGLVVHDPSNAALSASSYDEEKLLLIGDWYHRTANEVLSWYMRHSSFGNEPVPDSALVNGRGAYNCSMAVPARPVECYQADGTSMPILNMDSSKRYRLRAVNVGSFAGITLGIPKANLTVIEVDGGNRVVGESASSVGILYPGERVDLLAALPLLSQDASSTLEVILDDTNFRYANPALAANHDFTILTTGPNDSGSTVLDLPDYLSLDAVRSPSHMPDEGLLSRGAGKTLVVYAASLKMAHLSNVPHGFMNKTTWQPQQNPDLPLLSIPRAQWDEHQLVSYVPTSLESPAVVDLVVNGLDDGSHSFHLHGFDFYVLQRCVDGLQLVSHNPFDAPDGPPCGPYNTIDPVRKDTVLVPRRGYVVLRFLADNPGLWFFHCHLLWHSASGMSMTLQVGGDEAWTSELSNGSEERARAASMCKESQH